MNEQIRALLAYNSGMSFQSITDEAHLTKDLGFDSLDKVDLVLQMEDMFHVSIPDEEYFELQTVGQYQEYIQAKLKQKSIVRRTQFSRKQMTA